MSNSLQIQSCETPEAAVQAASEAVLTHIKGAYEQGNEVLLLLAGGSATKIYTQMATLLQTWEPYSLEHLALAVEDERWPSKSNTQAIRDTGLIETCEKLGAEFYELEGNNMAEAAKRFEEWISDDLQESNVTTIAVIGIGPDGHTLSVNADPEHPAAFAELFESSDLVTSYHSEATSAAFPEFPDRITLTLSGLKHVNQAIGLILGADKLPVLQDLKNTDKPSAQQPAQALKQIPTTLFTDQVV